MNYTINDFELTHLGKQAVLSHSVMLERLERLILNYVGSYYQSGCDSHRQQITQMFHRLVDKVNLTRLVVMKFLKFRGACVQSSKLISQVKEQCVLYNTLVQTDSNSGAAPHTNVNCMDNGMLVKQKAVQPSKQVSPYNQASQKSKSKDRQLGSTNPHKMDDAYVLELKKRLKSKSSAITKSISHADTSASVDPIFNIINGEYLYSA